VVGNITPLVGKFSWRSGWEPRRGRRVGSSAASLGKIRRPMIWIESLENGVMGLRTRDAQGMAERAMMAINGGAVRLHQCHHRP
jgi:hypothetical protein